MMSMSAAKTAGAVAAYFALHLREGRGAATSASAEIEDYYVAEGDRGRWWGSGLDRVGLAAREIRAAEFAQLAAGRSADGEALAQNAGDPDRRAGWDCTFSAPKSVSIAWALSVGEDRAAIEAVQRRAVESALQLLEEKAGHARCGRDGEDVQRARIAAALFDHGTSREQDPQLHTHAFIMNLGVREDGRVSSLDSRQIMRWQKAIGAAYRAELAHGLRQLGYHVERDGDAFRLAGISREADREFSQRRQQIEARLRELGLSDAKSSENVALETRKAKAELPREQLEAQWTARAQALGLDRAAVAALQRDSGEYQAEAVDATALLRQATEHDAVIDERQIYLNAALAAQDGGGVQSARLAAETSRLLAVELEGGRYTTREMIRIEREIVDAAQAGRDVTRHQLAPEHVDRAIAEMAFARGFELRHEQRAAVAALTTEAGATAVLVGDAGAGKSTALEAVRRAYEQAGFTVHGAALAGKAAAGLEEGAGIRSSTIDRMLLDLENRRLELTARSVVVIDEAGMVDSRKMHRVSEAARAAGAKLILVGDHKQLQPVAAGATFRHLASELGAVRLEHIARQREEWARDAVRQMSRGEAGAALSSYIERGLVTIENTHKAAVRACAQQFLAHHSEVGGRDVVAIAATNAAVRDLNREIRANLRQLGGLTDAREVEVRSARDPDERVRLELAPGERVLIGRNHSASGLRNGDFATVVRIDAGRLHLRVDRLEQDLRVDAADLVLRHGYAATTHKLQGATVERAVVLGSELSSREMAYVQASRARDTTNWVFAAAKVAKLAEREGVEPKAERPLERLREVVQAMGCERQKESTLDHRASLSPPTSERLRSVDRAVGLER